MKHSRGVVAAGLFAFAVGMVGAADSVAANAGTSIDVTLGSCQARLVSPSPWTRNGDGTYSTASRQVTLQPRGTAIELPILTSQAIRVNPTRLSFSIDARMLPIPKDGLFGELLAGGDGISGPFAAGIDTGKNIRARAPSIFLDPGTSYLYFLTTNPFVINLDKNNKNKPQRSAPNNKKTSSKKPKLTTMAFALDPCDPAVFFGGVNVTVQGVTGILDGMGVSGAGKVAHRTSMPVWTGRTLDNGQPDLQPYALDGHFYAKGTLAVGLGSFFSLGGTLAATVNLDPRKNGVLGLQEAMQLLKGKPPQTLPDVGIALEGSAQLMMPGVRIALARAAVGLDAGNPRAIKVQIAGERLAGSSFAELFPGTPPPGTDVIAARGALQIFGNATFDARAGRPDGTYQLKVRGAMNVAGLRVAGDVDVTYRGRGLPEVCLKLPGMNRMCGRDIENAAQQVGKDLVNGALASANFFARAGQDMEAAANEVFKGLGQLAKGSVHNLHGAPKCNAEARDFGTKLANRVRSKAEHQANEFFRTVNPKIGNLSAAEKKRVLKPAYDQLYGIVIDKRNRVEERGRSKVKTWSVNPSFGNQYMSSFSSTYKPPTRDLASILNAAFQKNVGIPWR